MGESAQGAKLQKSEAEKGVALIFGCSLLSDEQESILQQENAKKGSVNDREFVLNCEENLYFLVYRAMPLFP